MLLAILLLTLPPEAAAFVPEGQQSLAFESADLNGDGRVDHVLVTEQAHEGEADHLRTLQVLVRTGEGKLRAAARSDRVVYCRECGGMMGDPFMSVTLKPREIAVEHYGGSGWRWSNVFVFRYSRRDDAWQLVRVEERSFHASDPENVDEKTYRPPRDFGKIDLREFDPQDFLGQGPK